MIVLTRLNGVRFAINDEQIERLEDGPNTVVVLVNGNRYTALESLDEIVEEIVNFRARVLEAVPVADESEEVKHASVSLFRPHSILSDDTGVREVEDSPIPGRKPSVFGTFISTKKTRD